jgi:hypothetical protein
MGRAMRWRKTEMDHRRLLLVGVLCFAAPVAFISFALAREHAAATGWIAMFCILALGYGLLAIIVVSSARSGSRAVRETSSAHPEAVLVCRALDEQVRPRGVRTLVAGSPGIMLVRGRGRGITPLWTIAWSEVAYADTGAERFKTGNKPALRIHTTAGHTKVLGLVSGYGLRNSPEQAEAAVGIVNAHRTSQPVRPPVLPQ